MKTIQQKIQDLKKQKNAVILAHNYQLPEVQDIADFTGDSLGLSRQAASTDADVIVFCGVLFMAETAKILSPHKMVLIPDDKAGCPMADMLDAVRLRELKRQHPDAKVMCYVNSTAEVKAESDVCCTSANAVQLMRDMFSQDQKIIFVPDKYLGSYAAAQTGRQVIVWHGFCPTHQRILPVNIEEKKKQYPNARVMAHPECSAGVLALADAVLSTSQMLKYVKESDAAEFIVATENEMLYPLQKANPDKKFYAASAFADCPNMKKITLEKTLQCLETETVQVEVPKDIRERADKSIRAMLEFSAGAKARRS